MAALLRQGARRIQAAIRSPAVAEERRRLVTRRMYSTEEEAHSRIAREVQQKKDELYDLINDGVNNARTSTWDNLWLLPYLSGQVTPRPYNARWRDLQEARKTISGIKTAGFFSLAIVVVEAYGRFYSNENKLEEEDEISEVETRSGLMEN